MSATARLRAQSGRPGSGELGPRGRRERDKGSRTRYSEWQFEEMEEVYSAKEESVG